ncbi:MAG: magnesium transporter CorA family protein [Firmicutes bacterium]|nr:magnesium transporter CorA family protein [Bacillota bacterium]
MIRYFVTLPSEKKLTETDAPKKNGWIHLESPTAEELLSTAALTQVPEEFLNSAMDEEETAHLDTEDDARLIVVDIPKMAKEGNKDTISTVPLAIAYNDRYLVTVCTKSTTVLTDFFDGKMKNVDTARRARLVYQILLRNATRFLYYLKQIDKASDRIQVGIAKSMRNEELLQLVELQKSLVFFSASLTANQAVFQKIYNMNVVKAPEDEHDILEDILIESKQGLSMCSVFREIIKSTMDAFGAVVNNNQNFIMKFLTAITIILAIPTVIAGLWGMNTGVPFEGELWGFFAALGIAVVISVVVLIVLMRKKMM